MRQGLMATTCAALVAFAGLAGCARAPEASVSDLGWREQQRFVAAEQERVAREKRLQVESIETVLRADAAVSAATSSTSQERWRQMEAIDTSACPPEFRVSYYDHTQAWKDYVSGQNALASLNSDDRVGETLVAGFVCELLDCPATPVTDHLNTEQRLRAYVGQANGRIVSTWRELERIALAYGARTPA